MTSSREMRHLSFWHMPKGKIPFRMSVYLSLPPTHSIHMYTVFKIGIFPQDEWILSSMEWGFCSLKYLQPIRATGTWYALDKHLFNE